MPSSDTNITIDLRKVAHKHLTIRVQYKNVWWFKFGLLFIRLGCWITGAQFVDEFPMSLMQPGKATHANPDDFRHPPEILEQIKKANKYE